MHQLLYLAAWVGVAQGLLIAARQPLPLVIWHGLGDNYQGDGMKGIGDLASEVHPGTYVYNIRVSEDASEDRTGSYFGNLTVQLEDVCAAIAADPVLSTAPAIDALGFSQGGLFLRGYVERCNRPPVRSLVTMGSPHNGIAKFKSCDATDWLCQGALGLVRSNAWSDFIQSRIVPAQYYRDVEEFDAYLEHSNFLADINNERDEKRSSYGRQLTQLRAFAMYQFSEDTTIIPKESAWFQEVNITSGEVTPLRKRALYTEDWLGLRALDEAKRLDFRVAPGRHMELSDELLEEIFITYFGPAAYPIGDTQVELVTVVAVAVASAEVAEELQRAVVGLEGNSTASLAEVEEAEASVEATVASAAAAEVVEAEAEVVEEVPLNPQGSANTTPSLEVTKAEDDFINQKTSLSSLSIKDDFPRRPSYGKLGQAVLLRANYFEVVPTRDLVLYRYSAQITPAATGKKLRRIFALLFEHPEFAPINDHVATDNAATIVSRSRLEKNRLKLELPYRFEDELTPRDNAIRYRVLIQETGVFTIADLLTYLKSTNASASYQGREQAIQALNLVLGRYPSTSPDVACVGRNRFFPFGSNANAKAMDLGGGLDALRGFFSSVRVATYRILLNVNVSNTVVYPEIRLDHLIEKFAVAHGHNAVALEKFLKKVRVQVTHLRTKTDKDGQPTRRIKTIFGLATMNDGQGQPNPPRMKKYAANPGEIEFFQGLPPGASPSQKPGARQPPNRYTSVSAFFEREHNIKLQNKMLPVVNVGNRQNPIYLPAEVCKVLPGQSSMQKLTPDQTQAMLKFACRKPPENARSIVTDGGQVIGLRTPGGSALAPFGISVTAEMIVVPGRVLTGPAVNYSGNAQARTQFGSWNMRDVKFTTGAGLGIWSFMVLHMEGKRDPFGQAGPLPAMKAFYQALGKVGVTAPPPLIPGLNVQVGQNREINDQKISEAFETVLSKTQAKFMLVILPDTTAAIYNRVKFVADTKAGIHAVCVVASKFAKQEDMYFANVAHKVNLKRGGVNQTLEAAKLGIIAEGKTMVVGLDVTHPSPGSAKGAPSVAGIVASVGRDLGQWPADLRIQESRKEMVSDLAAMFKSRLLLWRTKNRAPPDNVLVYRDGVSEGQYETVLREELPLLRAGCKGIYPPDAVKKGLPRISIIVVGKRHHTRFYPMKEDDADRSSNPKNGTVVDRGVTEARNWDFFLQAHAGLQGTARPAHYFIVHDEIFGHRNPNPKTGTTTVADELEQLTHNMCYLFGRATKAVSICPPAYYADLVCERARCYLSRLYNAESAAGTPAQSVSGQPAVMTATPEDVRIHEYLKDTMFYI
ncbi:MAG: hypothetical protein M1838_005200 [Thelocarpon superellum]|nr:MAG: hypothetical protein M1838_005200 [Thelocarpon superellum]